MNSLKKNKRTSFSRLQVCSSSLFPPRRSDMKNLRFFTSFQAGSTPILGNPCGVGCCPQWEAVMNIYAVHIYIYIFVWLSMYVIDIQFFGNVPHRDIYLCICFCVNLGGLQKLVAITTFSLGLSKHQPNMKFPSNSLALSSFSQWHDIKWYEKCSSLVTSPHF